MQQSEIKRFEEHRLMPAEEKLEVRKRERRISIGIPANISEDEQCLPLTPQAVEIMVNAGHEVFVENNAGVKARYTDLQYSEAGAFITPSKAEIFQCDVILKVASFSETEISMLRGNQLIFSMLQIDTQSEANLRMLMQKKITAVAFEYMKDETGELPVMQSLSEISGIVALNVAAELLSNSSGGKGVLLGGVTGISPASVIILGAGSAAEYAARAAIGIGAEVKIFDSCVANLRAFEKKFTHKLFTSIYYPRVLKKAIGSADVVIGAQPFNSIPQYRIPEELVKKMKRGTIIIDLNVAQGGCFETSRCTSYAEPTFEKHGVIHYCMPNISARVSRTTTISLSNIFTSTLQEIDQYGGINHYIKYHKGFREGIYIYNGILTNKDLGAKFNVPAKDIDLLLAAF